MAAKQSKISMFLYFLRAYRWQTGLLLAVQFFVGFLDGLGIMALLPLITVMTQGVTTTPSRLSQVMEQVFSALHLQMNLVSILGLIMVIFVMKAALCYGAALYVSHMSAKIIHDFRVRFLNALLHSRWAFYTKKPVGEFINALLTEAQRSGSNFKSIADIIAAGLQIIILLAVASISSWQIVVLGGVASVFLWIVLYPYIRVTGKTGIRQKDISISINAQIGDILQNFKPLKAMNIEDTVFKKVSHNIYEIFRITKIQMMAKESLGIFHEPIFVAIMCVGLYGAIEVMHMDSATLMVMAALFYRLITAGKSLQQAYQVLCGKESFFWSFNDFIEEAEHDAERYEVGEKHRLERSIEFRDVSFDYGDRTILDHFNLKLETCKLTGILGPSGTGKTTIIDLLCGLYVPRSGEILIDGKPLNTLDIKFWRRNIGYVPQEFVIFNDDILGNLTLGDPDISEEDVIEALKKAEAWDFIQNLPQGLRTNLGERGSRLSGGQRQRISIARALVRKPLLLILDEATASLDPVTEKDVFDTLKKLSRTTTIISISHQDTMKQVADCVIDLGHKS